MLADFVQLTANRSASITRASKQSETLSVAVSGLSYQMVKGPLGPSTVEVSVEERRANVDPSAAGELGWEQLPAPAVQLAPAAGPNGTTVWSGQITLPKGPPRS